MAGLKKYYGITIILFALFLSGCNNTTEDDNKISIACYACGTHFEQFVSEYNEAHADFQIELTDYSAYNATETSSEGVDTLLKEILAGKLPDIILLNNLPLSAFLDNALLVDLYPYIEADETIAPDDFFVNALAAVESNGQLLFLPSSFFIDTLVVKSDSGISGGWTVGEMYEYMQNSDFEYLIHPSVSRTAFLEMLISHNITELIDYTDKAPLFDSELFKQIVEYVSIYPTAPGKMPSLWRLYLSNQDGSL